MAIEFIYSTTGHKNRILPNSQIRSFVFYGATFKKGIRMATRAIKKIPRISAEFDRKNIFFSPHLLQVSIKKDGMGVTTSRPAASKFIDTSIPFSRNRSRKKCVTKKCPYL